jgi:uncharacterized damage-inducible protein DinB
MKAFYLDKFAYSHQTTQRMIAHLLSLESKLNDSILTHISHLINAHEIWNSRILERKNNFSVWQQHEPQNWAVYATENYQLTQEIIECYSLSEVKTYATSTGETFSNKIEAILYHVLNHTNYHTAQMNTQLRILELQPLSTDYIFYARTIE